jgi:hypothetical protein
MKLYKYRSLDNANNKTIDYIRQIIINKQIWCSNVNALNDPDEFRFRYDFTPTENTCDYLARVLCQYGYDQAAQALDNAYITSRLASVAQPIIENIENECRENFGITCFGKTSANEILWKRYAGDGNGICIELDVLDEKLLIWDVNYVATRIIHIDIIFQSVFEREAKENIYKLMLATKTSSCWAAEQEIRFISCKPDVLLKLNVKVSKIFFGKNINPVSAEEICRIAAECTEPPILETYAV